MVWLKATPLGLASYPSPAGVRPPASELLGKLRRLIEEGRFAAGSRLPPERALAAELHVGRPALREAIKALSVLGMVESRRGSGTLVKSVEPATVASPLAASLATSDFGMLELLEVRKILEPRAAWLAATRAAARHLVEIENARQRLELHDRDWKLVARLDCELHSAIFRGAQNPVLVLINQFLTTHIIGKRAGRVRFAPDVERMRRDHQAIVSAILKRQADAAEKAMVEHLNSVGLDLITEESR
jgi:GntR family transcriptional repressor for pyruvate dehydrogenase complex